MSRPLRRALARSALALALALVACGDPPAPEPDSTRVTLAIDGVGELPIHLNPNDRMITPMVLEKRHWEPIETHWFVQSLRPGDVVVDVGANVGYYTLIASRLVGETGRVYAFEPDPESFALLTRNVRESGLDNVVLEQKGVSDRAGTLELYLSESNRGDHRIFQPEGESRRTIEVESVALDDYFAGRHAEVDFVKIDTQGAELLILRGMREILAGNDRLVLAVEYAPKLLREFGFDALELLDLLEANDFRFFDMNVPVKAGLFETDRAVLQKYYRDRSDFFTNLLSVKAPVVEAGTDAPGFPRPEAPPAG
ncbi:MAG: FkbM family methyltransferase [Myxococcota bacterium]